MKALLASLGSYVYRTARARTIRQVYRRQEQEGRPRDLEEVVEIGDRKLKRSPPWAYNFPIPKGIMEWKHW